MAAYSDRAARRPSSRPRSLYAAQNPTSSYLSGYGSSSSYLNTSNPYSSSSYSLPSFSSQLPFSASSQSPYGSQSAYTTYGGTSSGYGGLTLPSSSAYNLSSSPKMSSSPSSYLNNWLQSSNFSGRTGSPTSSTSYSHRPTTSRSNSFNRHHPTPSLGSRSSSALSLRKCGRQARQIIRAQLIYVWWKQPNSEIDYKKSAGDKSGRSSRLSSSTDGEATANGEIDYKKLYEESLVENERLREKLRKTEEDLKESKAQTDKNLSPGKNSMSELEKRERRAMERKLSEMEEELKQLQKLKAENERLRAENRALTRVVSKLTASANAGK
ncbi:hypothetical protein J6590_014293 [Homalodisca vitripennis]|nr:hypothetical protein J6590_014293 [Homalodisca vitripennis]